MCMEMSLNLKRKPWRHLKVVTHPLQMRSDFTICFSRTHLPPSVLQKALLQTKRVMTTLQLGALSPSLPQAQFFFPKDVCILLKFSDFITHDLSIDTVFEGCQCDTSNPPSYQLELVLRKWYPIDRSRELRCFVREDHLIGISQRDPNFYDFMTGPKYKATS
ncbi:D123-domain-containing protein [Suillus decipiens]|nr:D123-domain-containing protein [Suillus decipiens]